MGFSRSARLNLMRAVKSVDQREVLQGFFGTNTVPAGEADWASIERHRRAWVKRTRRHLDRLVGPAGWFMIWKKEPHKNGTPHLHWILIITGAARCQLGLADLRAFNDGAWADVVKSDNPAHAVVGCRVELMRTYRGVSSYASKYLAKEQEFECGTTGRIWGFVNRGSMPVTVKKVELSEREGKRVHRWMRKLAARRRPSWWLEKRAVRNVGGGQARLVHSGWQRISPSWEGKGKKRVRVTVEEKVADLQTMLRDFECKQRLVRRFPRVGFNRDVPLWVEDVESGKIEHHGAERHFQAPGLMFLPWRDVVKLAAYSATVERREDRLGWSKRGALPF